MKRRSVALVVLAGVTGLGVVAVAPAASAAPGSCLVVDTNSNVSYTGLQAAVTAAAPGDTLFVKGTCTGTTTISGNLTITGQSNGGNGTATLNGGGQSSVLALTSSAVVTINTLVITGGKSIGEFKGGGITNLGGTLTLNNSAVSGNTSSGVPGENSAGGIANLVTGVLTLNNSTVAGNTMTRGEGGGILSALHSRLTLNNSTVTGNTAAHSAGGGIFVDTDAPVTLNNSSVTGNTATGGGGIAILFGTVILNGNSTVTGNTASIVGGGISNPNDGTVTLNDSSSVTGNTPDDCFPAGSVPGCTS
jgi:hypothetical protein